MCLHGAVSSKELFKGKGSKLFFVCNLGVQVAIKGISNYCTENMTGKRLVVLEETIRNFRADASGGIAHVHDYGGKFPEKFNT